jgi:hypothetical protein
MESRVGAGVLFVTPYSHWLNLAFYGKNLLPCFMYSLFIIFFDTCVNCSLVTTRRVYIAYPFDCIDL